MRQWTYKLAKMDMRGALKPVKKEIVLDEKEVFKFLLILKFKKLIIYSH
jgi:hypothetical protein